MGVYHRDSHMSIKRESWESRIPGTQGCWQALFWKIMVFHIDCTQMLYMCLPATVSAWQTAFQMLNCLCPPHIANQICLATPCKVPARPYFSWFRLLFLPKFKEWLLSEKCLPNCVLDDKNMSVSANQCKLKFAWPLSEECLPNRHDKFPHLATDNNIWTLDKGLSILFITVRCSFPLQAC